MHRSSSSTQLAGFTPGDCGSEHTPMNRSGKMSQTRRMRSLLTWVHSRLMTSSPKWCPMCDALGEKSIRSVPRST